MAAVGHGLPAPSRAYGIRSPIGHRTVTLAFSAGGLAPIPAVRRRQPTRDSSTRRSKLTALSSLGSMCLGSKSDVIRRRRTRMPQEPIRFDDGAAYDRG